MVTLVRTEDPFLSSAAVDAVVERVLARVGGLGPLDPLLADPAITEVMVNGPGPVWVERHGRLERTEVILQTATIEHLIERIVGPLGLRVDRSSPLVDARLADGSRVNAVVPPLAVDGPCLTIRRFGARPIELEELTSAPVAELLRWAVRSRSNVVVSGGAGAGKTTLLNALAASIPAHERIVTVEDAAELRLPGDHVVRLEARPASAEGSGAVTIRDLVRNALRMRPDRLLVGEARGAEAFDLLQAMNTGHEGSLSTCHANGPDDALRRLETMVLLADVGLSLVAVREQLTSAVDLVVHVTRLPDGARAVSAVAEVLGGDATRPAPADGGLHRSRLLAAAGRVVALPERPARAAGARAPDPAWMTS
ncbi:MAG: CpaF family protein [Actinomycetota bacterium]|nr:CpaF family protein [Actinomycetota bacterium]